MTAPSPLQEAPRTRFEATALAPVMSTWSFPLARIRPRVTGERESELGAQVGSGTGPARS